jgi:hypothetical protein
LLTLIVYKKDKPGLKFDLAVIAAIQLIALVYGTFTLYQERPYYMVFIVDRLNLVAEKHIDKSKLRFDELQEKPFAEVIRVYARMPEGDEYQAFLTSVVFDRQPDMEGRPEYWEPYAAGTETILKRVTEQDQRRVEQAVDTYSTNHPRLGYLPISTLEKDIGMLMDMDTAEPIDVIEVDPW